MIRVVGVDHLIDGVEIPGTTPDFFDPAPGDSLVLVEGHGDLLYVGLELSFHLRSSRVNAPGAAPVGWADRTCFDHDTYSVSSAQPRITPMEFNLRGATLPHVTSRSPVARRADRQRSTPAGLRDHVIAGVLSTRSGCTITRT